MFIKESSGPRMFLLTKTLQSQVRKIYYLILSVEKSKDWNLGSGF